MVGLPERDAEDQAQRKRDRLDERDTDQSSPRILGLNTSHVVQTPKGKPVMQPKDGNLKCLKRDERIESHQASLRVKGASAMGRLPSRVPGRKAAVEAGSGLCSGSRPSDGRLRVEISR